MLLCLDQGDQVKQPHGAHYPEKGFCASKVQVFAAEVKGTISLASDQ